MVKNYVRINKWRKTAISTQTKSVANCMSEIREYKNDREEKNDHAKFYAERKQGRKRMCQLI